MILITAYNSYTKRGTVTILTLEIANNGLECVDVHILRLPACPYLYDITTQTMIKHLAIKRSWKHYLSLSYPDFVIKVKATDQSIQLLETLAIPWLPAHKVHGILQIPFLAHVTVKHQGCVYLLDK